LKLRPLLFSLQDIQLKALLLNMVPAP